MKHFKLSVAVLLLLFASSAFAANDPVTLLNGLSKQMLSSLKKSKATVKSNPRAVYKIVRRVLVPHADMQTMSRSVVGRTAWKNATAMQREEFTKEFTTLVVRTYGSALAMYTNETVVFKPIRGGISPGQNRVQVDSVIVRKQGPSIPVGYHMVLRNGKWKVYDIIVDGVSLVQSFRAQFASVLASGGMSQLITIVMQHNAQSK